MIGALDKGVVFDAALLGLGALAVIGWHRWQEHKFNNEVRRVIAHANLITKEASQ